ncbi:CRISPR system precrRNA processing endoribonuclease RAMP protein Cas6 [Candidatus Cyanaurora vandensis]|uniref:CRISPR system precrRNA processing endoribonuclease RAMP protein Cas6 n=1 Tax=Candidatus Cyanaurora vandensis TaxID=2714958 RepID=UPI002580BDEE|nr:CRISPR system precrRNA processing endoribonuclease RAMP protein Cas6 [Candidatus Cyanaurora vandensis]
MPHSLTIHLVPEQTIPAHFTEGRHLHALFLHLVREVDPSLSAELHEERIAKAFAVSPLQVGPGLDSGTRRPRDIPAGTPCWWRLCLLEEQLFARLGSLWLGLQPVSWQLGPASLRLSHILSTGAAPSGGWAATISYPDLLAQASPDQRDITLQFRTPTAFRQGTYDSALPVPRSLFATPYRRWQEYATVPLALNLLELITEHLHPTRFDLHTGVHQDTRSTFIGCLGTATYRLFGALEPHLIQQVNALADYLFFTGSGRKTTMGMGQVTRLLKP